MDFPDRANKLACTLFLCLAVCMMASAAPKRPNIVFLLTDDQRADTIRALGNDEIITPNLDKLVESGMSFTNAYCHGSWTPAVCLASRAMLITGQNWERLDLKKVKIDRAFGGKKLKQGYPYPKTPTLPQLFNKAGYYTGALIKRGPSPKGLEADFTYTHELSAKVDRLGGFSGKDSVDQCMKFLDAYDRSEAGKGGRPYLLYVGMPGPHDERFIDKKYLDMYKKKPSLPANYQATYGYANGFSHFGRDNCLVPHPRTEEMIRTELHYYYGMITSIDENIGRLVEKIKERGEYGNTIFVFASDQGLSIGSHGMLGKQNLFEEAMKAPLIMAGPGIPVNKRSDAKAFLHDLFATFCDFASITVPDGLHSRTLTPILQGKSKTHREHIYMPFSKNFCSLRKGDYKLIKFMKVERPQLFNLAKDSGEMNDLAANPEYVEILRKMEKELKRVRSEHGATEAWPTKYSHPHLKTISPEEVARLRQKEDQKKGEPKQAINTREARKKAGHTN